MSSHLNYNRIPLGQAHVSGEFSDWNEEWLRGGADSQLLADLGKSALVLHDIEYFLLPETGARVSFAQMDGFEEGREDSKHEITFGELEVSGHGAHREKDFVALKPFDDPEDLKREWAVSQYLNDVHDDQLALLPLGIYKDLDGNNSLMTFYEKGIKSLDNIFWADKNTSPEALRRETVHRHIKLGMTALGALHGSRVIHNDAQAKNMANDRKNFRFIDLEDAEIIHEDLIDDPLSIEKTRRDLSAFIGSLSQVDENKSYILPVLRDSSHENAYVKAYARGVREGRSTQEGLYIPNFGKENEEAIRDYFRKQ